MTSLRNEVGIKEGSQRALQETGGDRCGSAKPNLPFISHLSGGDSSGIYPTCRKQDPARCNAQVTALHAPLVSEHPPTLRSFCMHPAGAEPTSIAWKAFRQKQQLTAFAKAPYISTGRGAATAAAVAASDAVDEHAAAAAMAIGTSGLLKPRQQADPDLQ